MGIAITTLRAMASRRQGPPRTKRGRQIMYRVDSYDLWLKKREIDYDEMREAKPKRRANARRK